MRMCSEFTYASRRERIPATRSLLTQGEPIASRLPLGARRVLGEANHVYVDPRVDPATRTAHVRIELANPGQVLKIGMYVNVAFGALGLAEKTAPIVPKDAVQTIGNQQYVFVATENPNEFILRPVRLGLESNGFYTVMEGVSTGDRVVTQGSFLLRAEWLKTHPTE
jgi:Cu(I)/Ag(I) efflux system membrane fusion protein